MRDEQGAATLSVEGSSVKDTGERISTGVSPYSVDVDSNGHWAIIGNVGLGGKPSGIGKVFGDTDTVTLVDVSKRPFRAVQHLTVPSNPEGVAISPNGKWIAAQTMDGSQLTKDNPGRHPRGKVVLFAIDKAGAHKVNEMPGGEGAQGIVFTKDSQTILVQFDVEKELAIYECKRGKLVDTNQADRIVGRTGVDALDATLKIWDKSPPEAMLSRPSLCNEILHFVQDDNGIKSLSS